MADRVSGYAFIVFDTRENIVANFFEGIPNLVNGIEVSGVFNMRREYKGRLPAFNGIVASLVAYVSRRIDSFA